MIKVHAIVKVDVQFDENIRQVGCEVICVTQSKRDAIGILGELQARDGEAGVNFYLYETEYDETSRPDVET